MNPRRKTFLKELGIDLWRRRALGAPEPEQTVVVNLAPLGVAPPVAAGSAVPHDFAEPAMAKRGRPPKIQAPLPVSGPPPPVVANLPPIEVPQDWAGLRAMIKDCTRCKLCQTRTQTVFGVGVEDAPLMVVGEGPGADEDAQGEPFVGRAGKLLDEMLRSIGRSRSKNVFIANVVKCRPPGNRDPEPDEVEACRPYLEQQIKLIKPKLILGLGRIAAQRLLNTQEPLSRLRGPLFTHGANQTPLFITYHPAYLLRSPREKAKSWEDLKKVHRFLGENGG